VAERRIGQLPLRRLGGIAAVAAALLAVGILLFGGGSSYKVHADFIDAGQLVKGGLVQVGGRPIGTVGNIDITDDGLADVTMNITDDRYDPLHVGTVTRIRTVGLSGVANRFIDVAPAPSSAPAIPDGGTIPTKDTRPVVDLDELLDSLDAPTRTALQSIIRDAADIYDDSSAAETNHAFHYLNPALGQARALSDQLAFDTAADGRLVRSASEVFSALAQRRSDVQQGITDTATTLRSIAGRRTALRSALARLPAVLRQGTGTLSNVRSTLIAVQPALRELVSPAAPLAEVLRKVVPTARSTTPTARRFRTLVPELRRGLDGLPALERAALPALESTTSAVKAARPIFAGLRPYAPELIGIFNGFGGVASASYDANGHFVRVEPQLGANSLTGLSSLLPGFGGADAQGYRTGLDARCPGALATPAADGSNPWIPDASLCNPSDGHR
jgi:phospholipid/cholesterol/gamma-HCH transport system substrate-binding protein